MNSAGQPLLSVAGLEVRFGDDAPAVSNVELSVHSGQTVAIVGESGSGKATVSQAILRILPRNGHIAGGQILFNDRRNGQGPIDLAALGADGAEMRALRGGSISIVFQEPMTRLNPLARISEHFRETLKQHEPNLSEKDIRRRALETLGRMGIPPTRFDQYPH